MTRRSQATMLAGVLTALLLGAALVVPLPYVVYQPGSTVDLLAEQGGEERVHIEGHRTYATTGGGELRMTTIVATPPGSGATLTEALMAWVSGDSAVKPYDAVYDDGDTEEKKEQEGARQMASSQEVAIAVGLQAAGVKVRSVPVALPVADSPAAAALEPLDRFLSIGDTVIRTWDDVVEAITGAPKGEPIRFVVDRAGEEVTVDITPIVVDGDNRVGIEQAFDYHFPFPVEFRLGQDIGGPSAGLFFALAVYDTLTPGDLTGGLNVAGTGEIAPNGAVGAIGGIAQKIAAARDAKTQLFLAPAANCNEAVDAPNGDVTVAAVVTFEDALATIEKYAADPGADLLTCEEVLADE